jgi:hypothetical protein
MAVAAITASGLAGLTGLPALGAMAPSSAGLFAGVQDACSAPALGDAACATQTFGTAAITPTGYTPSDLRSAYGFQSDSAGMRQTVAVVTAFDDPSAESDLAAYRSNFGMPACTTANGCFLKADQNGGTNYPPTQAGWPAATALSVDMISAVCPNCHIVLVEGNSSAISDLGTAENTAVQLGAKFIANTYYTPEATYGAAEPSYDSSYFNHPGVAITAPAGNNGFAMNYPAASPNVIAVGGTTLTTASSGSRGWTETTWSGTGSGCSAYESAKPSWQTDTGCADRTVNDVAAVADPVNSAVAFYNAGAWVSGGGTTASAAIVAAAYALAGTPAASTNPASYPYANSHLLNDITSGSDGTCSVSYLCTAGKGYDGPTGLGTPAATVPFNAKGAVDGAIYSGEDNRCLDDYNGDTSDGNKIDLGTCNGWARQDWTVEADGTVQDYGKCMEVSGGGTSDGTKVDLSTCNGWARQQWRPYARGALINPSSGKCLDDPGGSTTDGTPLDIATCDGWARQRWNLPYHVPSSSGPIVSGAASGKCVEDKDGSTANGNTVWLEPCSGWARQDWSIKSDGTLQVLGECLTNNGSTSNGDPIQINDCNGRTSQQWQILADGSLMNPWSGECIGLSNGGSTANGTTLMQWTCNGNNSQRWVLPS